MSLVDLKERIAINPAFTVEERNFLLALINADPAEWTCGHTAGMVCAECHQILARKATELAAENMRLCELLADYARVNKRGKR
jgi:hypothetical protein